HLILLSRIFFFSRYGHHRDLHSFPTRRSSDLRNSPASRRRRNSSRVRKWYAAPSRSPGRALRVVADTEYPKRSGCRVTSSRAMRSEEHTSELQSLAYLVCRLLLEKKKQNKL